jgi:carbon-monoxide dehydrogenase medium subunit
MYPPKFDYVAPETLDEALSRLEQSGDEAKVLAGGQSLIPLLRLRFASPSVLVDLNRIPGLASVEETASELRVGALARHNELAASSTLAARYHVMAAAAPQIADPLVRNLGTIGGSIAHADPAGDWGSVMLALGAKLVARSRSGERVIPIEEFFQGVFQSALKPTEILTQIRVPRPKGGSGGTYLKLERKVGDFATVGVAVHLTLKKNGRIDKAGIGLTSVGPQNIKASEAEASLAGAEPNEKAFGEAAKLAAEAAQPASDVRGSAEYKRNVVRVYVQRGLTRALEIARSA